MKRIAYYGLALAMAGTLASSPVHADKPSWAGGGDRQEKGKGHSRERDHGRDRSHSAHRDEGHFTDRHRVVIREYYVKDYRTGHCPPGLAKKNNGCMPPGQAKKWAIGRPLPRGLAYYDLPRDLILRLRPPGEGYKYVRAAADVLLIAVGTMVVIDAIEDLSRM